ncbi:MAG: 23S rRNA methyltransferase [Gammaproteobacteria bacterium]|nr:23S rRNA methyltransferase [Gammaproteobacteria bacterium]
MTRARRARNWHRQHAADHYTHRAFDEGWRSRAVYKLEELDRRDHLFRPGMLVLDLGSAPGGWSQYAAKRLGDAGEIIALDILPMQPLARVEFLQVDFRDDAALQQLSQSLGSRRVNLVMSDMAPNLTGVTAIDQPHAMDLAELCLQLAQESLAQGGDFVVKLFQGEGYSTYVSSVRKAFGKVALRKPAASRPQSREVYLVAKNYRL